MRASAGRIPLSCLTYAWGGEVLDTRAPKDASAAQRICDLHLREAGHQFRGLRCADRKQHPHPLPAAYCGHRLVEAWPLTLQQPIDVRNGTPLTKFSRHTQYAYTLLTCLYTVGFVLSLEDNVDNTEFHIELRHLADHTNTEIASFDSEWVFAEKMA